MATIRTAIQLYNGMTPGLKSISNALDSLISTMESVQHRSRNMFDTSNLQAARGELQRANSAFMQMDDEIERARRSQEAFNNETKRGRGEAEGLLGTIKKYAGAYVGIRMVGNAVTLADEVTQNSARLNMIVDDGGSVKELENKIFRSAQRSRGSYLDTADAVAKMSLRAGNVFTSNDETIAFVELLNKQFTIAGTSQQEMASATLQLTQALGSGVLRGEEFNAVFEAAPNIMQTVADYMGVPIGQLRNMAAEGQITSEVIKNAMFAASGEIEERFNDMPKTFADIWSSVKNQAIMSFQPILEKMREIANGERFQAFINDLVNLLNGLAVIAAGVFNILANIGGFLYDNWSIIGTAITGVLAVMGIFFAVTKGYILLQTACKAVTTGFAIAQNFLSMGFGVLTGRTVAASAAVLRFNSSLMGSPLTWIVLILSVIISLVYVIIAVINKLTGASVSATGVICGALAVAVAFILNTVIGVVNSLLQLVWTMFAQPFLGIIEWILNVANGGFNSFGGAVANLIGQIISWFLSLGKVVTTVIDAIFGTDTTGKLTSWQDTVTKWGKNDESITLSKEVPLIDKRFGYGDAWDAGNKFGAGLEDKVKNLFSAPDIGGENPADYGVETSLGAISDGVGQTAENTAAMANNMEMSDENLKFLREMAEQQAINKFTTAEIRVEMTNNNQINSEQDIDGFINTFALKVQEAMVSSAEGVHI